MDSLRCGTAATSTWLWLGWEHWCFPSRCNPGHLVGPEPSSSGCEQQCCGAPCPALPCWQALRCPNVLNLVAAQLCLHKDCCCDTRGNHGLVATDTLEARGASWRGAMLRCDPLGVPTAGEKPLDRKRWVVGTAPGSALQPFGIGSVRPAVRWGRAPELGFLDAFLGLINYRGCKSEAMRPGGFTEAAVGGEVPESPEPWIPSCPAGQCPEQLSHELRPRFALLKSSRARLRQRHGCPSLCPCQVALTLPE